MPRQARKESGTGIYHVMLRGINRQDIFCFVNAVNHIEYEKKLEITKNGEMIIPQEIDPVKDDEKV